jgi:hypothetical protein
MTTLVELIRAIAWPTVALIALFVFRDSIKKLLERATKVGPGGIEAAPPKQEIGKDTALVTPSAADKLLKEFDNKLLVETEKIITDFLDSSHLEGTEREKVLVRYFAGVAITERFERIWFWIWGSQLKTLNALNSIKPNGLPVEGLEEFYNGGKSMNPELYTNYGFEQWLAFLKTWALVREDAGKITITVAGEEFLKFLVQTGLTTNKPG